jgi:hypothetical protein
VTPFTDVYDAFFNLITDDMYMEITKEDTERDCRGLLMASIPLFEFPNQVLTFEGDSFTVPLTLEEINILAMGMNQIWLQRQTTSIEVTRQKFSGADFRLTSQSSHLQRLMALLSQTKDEHRRLQMLYTRRRLSPRTGGFESTFDLFVKPMR